MSNNCSISVGPEVAAVKTVVDASAVIVANVHDTDLPAVKNDTGAIKVIADAYNALKPASGTIDTAETMKNRIVSPSEDLLNSNDAEVSVGEVDYELAKDVVVLAAGLYRIKFDIKLNPGPSWVYGKIYINGVAVGTERKMSDTSYETFSEDIAVCAADSVQLYSKSGEASYTPTVRNFRFYGVLNSTWFLNKV